MSARLPTSPVERVVEVILDGTPYTVPAGVTVAVALLLVGERGARGGTARTVFCGMGSCYECVADVDGVPRVRTCITPVADGMRVDTGRTTNRG